MAKERSAEKKEKKEKRSSEANGVTKTKKEKKSKKTADVDVSEMDVDDAASDAEADESVVANGAEAKGIVKLAPFAVPMADDKIEKKVMKGVKRCMCLVSFFVSPG